MRIGDKVTVIKSPYDSVKNGGEYIIIDILLNHFGFGKHIYVPDTKTNRLFRKHKIKKEKND